MTRLLSEGDDAPFTIFNANSTSPFIFLCQHAGRSVPSKLMNLDLPEDVLSSHCGWDIGTDSVGKHLAEVSGATMIMANYSRLVIDLNRSLTNAGLIPVTAEGCAIPINEQLGDEDKATRISEIYQPYHQAVQHHVDRVLASGQLPFVVDIHSFTKKYYNYQRPWDIGLLWLRDDRLPKALNHWFSQKGYHVGDNKPYDTKLMREGSLPNTIDPQGLPNVLVECANHHVRGHDQACAWAQMLWDALCAPDTLKECDRVGDTSPVVFDKEASEAYLSEVASNALSGQDYP